MEWKNLYRGFLMGVADVIPGVSGGTIALLLGIYERLIAGISGFFSTKWKQQLGFLIPLGIGIVVAVLSVARLMEWLFEHHTQPTQFFFMGLIVGILPFLLKHANARKTFKAPHYILIAVGIVIMVLVGLLNTADGTIMTNLTASDYALLFGSAAAASAAMIMPGISGSFMLYVLGTYTTVIASINDLRFDVIVVTVVGILLGFALFSRIVKYFLNHHFTLTYAATTGLVFGSLYAVFPGWPTSGAMVVLCLGTAAAGLLAAYLLGRFEYK